MASITPSQREAKEKYRTHIELLAPRKITDDEIAAWPGFDKLREFIDLEHDPCGKPPKISIVTIGESVEATGFPVDNSLKGYQELLARLPAIDSSPSSHLIVVENICPATLLHLGGAYDIDPQLFADHINTLSWYQMHERVPGRLGALPSTKKAEDFHSIKFVETRQLDGPEDDASSILESNNAWTRIWKTAGRLKPIPIALDRDVTFSSMAFTRQTVSFWCRKKRDNDGWISIMLVDPPFRVAEKHGTLALGQPEYRTPSLCPKMGEEFDRDETRQEFRLAFCRLLKHRLSADPAYLKACATNTFLVFYEAYRLIASEWLVVNEYVNRELANIERHFEKRESTFQELENHTKELYRIRRRCNKDHELMTEAALLCKKRGQALWPSSAAKPNLSEVNTFVERHAQELEEDFKSVLDKMGISISRIDKDISVLTALVAISGGRQALQENRGVSFLVLLATIFLPSSTVATVLGIQTEYGPGAEHFWLLWALALPLTVLVIVMPLLYSGVREIFNLTSWKSFPVKRDRTSDRPRDLQGGGIEMSDTPVPLNDQMLRGSMV